MRQGAVLLSCIAGSLVASDAMAAGLVVVDPWMRSVLPNLPASGYFTLVNPTAEAAVLTAAMSPSCGMLALERTETRGDRESMTEVATVPVPARGRVTFAPGGYHLMCMMPAASLVPGSRIAVTLGFKDGQRLSAAFPVRDARGR